MQAGPPYALDPWTLDTLRGSPDLLDGLLIDGIAPSTTGSDFLDRSGDSAVPMQPLIKYCSRIYNLCM